MSKAKLFIAGLWVLCGVAIPKLAGSQQSKPLWVEDVLKVRSFGQLVPIGFSPDGKWLAYTIQDKRRTRSFDPQEYARTGVPVWAIGTDIWISNTENDGTRNLTTGKGNNWLPVWSPDGHYLAFVSDRDASGQAKLWIWEVKKNSLRKVSDTKVRAERIEWTLDSKNLLVTTVSEGLTVEDYVKEVSSTDGSVKSRASKAPGSTVTLYQSGTFSATGEKTLKSDPWNLNDTLRDLSSVDVDSGKMMAIVHGKRIASYFLSPDGSRVAYTSPKRFEKPGSQQILFDLATISLRMNQHRILASDIRLDYDGAAFSWSPDGSQLSFHTGGMEERISDCFGVNVEEGGPRNLTMFSQPARFHRKASAPLWDKKGHIYFIRDGALWKASVRGSKAVEFARIPSRQIMKLISQSDNLLWTVQGSESTVVLTHDDVGKQDGFYEIALASGYSTKLLEKGQCYSCVNLGQPFAVTKDGRYVAYFEEDAQRDTDAWVSDASFGSPRRLTRLNPEFDKYQLGLARLIAWQSLDGEQLRAALLLPAGYTQGKRYPLIVCVYGGVSLSNNLVRFGLGPCGGLNMQLFATRGYAVLMPDAPQHMGTPMLDLAKTVLPAVDKVIRMGIADPDRLGVMGHSYGSYSTLSLIVQTKRFKAAIAADGFGDLISAYGQMNAEGAAYQTAIMEGGQGLLGGSPWQFLQRYIDNSPFFYLDRVETPLLIVHGAKDRTVASFLGDELFVGLRRLGKEVQYAKYEGEGHSPPDWSYENQVDYCNRVIAWFDKHLKR